MNNVNAWIAMAYESKNHGKDGDELLDTIRTFIYPYGHWKPLQNQ